MSRQAWLLFLAVSAIWGVPYLFIKVAVAEFSPAAVVWLRCLIAAAFLLPLAIRRGGLGAVRSHLVPIGFLAVVEITGPWMLISAGEQYVSSSLAGLLIATVPLSVAILAVRLLPSERVTGKRFIGLIIGFSGVLALLGLDASANPQTLLGAGMIVLAAFGYGLGALIIKRWLADVPPLVVTTSILTINAVILAPVGLPGMPSSAPSPQALGSVIMLGLVCSAIGLISFFALVAKAGASRASVITYINPAVAAGLGVALLGEPLTATMVAGFLLIIAGSWLSTDGRIPPALVTLLSPLRPRRPDPGETPAEAV